jgi:ribosomal subunit interface protein
MQIHIKTTGFDMTEAIENYLDKKLKNVKRLIGFAPGKREVWIELSKTTQHHNKGNYFEAKIDIELKRKPIHEMERAENLYEAIDKMESKIGQELKHYKDKSVSKDLRQARKWKLLTHLSPFAFIKRKGQRDKGEGM